MYGDPLENVRQCVEARRGRKTLFRIRSAENACVRFEWRDLKGQLEFARWWKDVSEELREKWIDRKQAPGFLIVRIEYIRQCIWTRVCEEHQEREDQHRSAVLGDRIGISMKLRRKHPRSGNNTSNGKQTKKSASEGFQWHQSSNEHVNGSAQQSISIEQVFSLLKDRVLSKQLFTNALFAYCWIFAFRSGLESSWGDLVRGECVEEILVEDREKERFLVIIVGWVNSHLSSHFLFAD